MSYLAVGSSVNIDAATPSRGPWMAACQLDATHFVAIFQDQLNSGQGYACIGTISGGNVSWGSKAQFDSNVIAYTDVSMIDSTHFIISYNRNGGDGRVIIGAVSGGNSISFGTSSAFTSGQDIRQTSVTVLDSTHFALAWETSATGGIKSLVGIMSGTSVSSYGTAVDLDTSSNCKIARSIAALDSTHFVISYRDGGSSDNGKAAVGVVSAGTTITFGSQVTFKAAGISYPSVIAMSSTTCIIAWNTSTYASAILGTISGNVISFGTEYQFDANQTESPAICKLDSTHFAIGYVPLNGTYSSCGVGLVATISGGTILYSDYRQFKGATMDGGVGIAPLTSTSFAIAYSHQSDQQKYGAVGTAQFSPYTSSLSFGAYALTGNAMAPDWHVKDRGIALSQGAYTLTGKAVLFPRSFGVIMSTGLYTVTMQTATALRKWINRTKNLTSWTNRTKI